MAAHTINFNLNAKQEEKLTVVVAEYNANTGQSLTADEAMREILIRELRGRFQKVTDKQSTRVGEAYEAANSSVQDQVDTLLNL